MLVYSSALARRSGAMIYYLATDARGTQQLEAVIKLTIWYRICGGVSDTASASSGRKSELRFSTISVGRYRVAVPM